MVPHRAPHRAVADEGSHFLEHGNVATILVLLVAVVGACVVLFGHGLTFDEYYKLTLGGGVGLAVARGLKTR